jgi:hypothetical protein
MGNCGDSLPDCKLSYAVTSGEWVCCHAFCRSTDIVDDLADALTPKVIYFDPETGITSIVTDGEKIERLKKIIV